MGFRSLQTTTRYLYRALDIRHFSYLPRSSRSYSSAVVNVSEIISGRNFSSFYKVHNCLPCSHGDNMALQSKMVAELPIFSCDIRCLSTQLKAPALGQKMASNVIDAQAHGEVVFKENIMFKFKIDPLFDNLHVYGGAMKVSMLSPGIIYEPYAPREPISFLRRWFTRSGWKRTKEDLILEMKSAYAISKMRKAGYSKKKFYIEALDLYKEINTLMANGDKQSLRKLVTEQMYSALKNEIKLRESQWSKVYWELIEPVVKIRTLRARMIGVDRDDLSKVFIQSTLEFLTKQKFEAYDSTGAVVKGDKDKEVLVKDIWVFEKSQFHPGSYWRLCGRISVKPDAPK